MQPMTERSINLARFVRLLASDRDALSSRTHLRLSATQTSLYASYLLLMPRSVAFVWNAIMTDLAMFIELGARNRAIDISVVLCRFLLDHYPEVVSLFQDIETKSEALENICPCVFPKRAHDDA